MKKTNKKINKKAFSKAEFMIMLAAIAILIAVGSKLVLDNTKNYSSFKTVANNFANAVAKYKDVAIIPKEEYTLFETEKAGYIDELKNPFDKTQVCDKYESYVSVKDNSRKGIVLLCGDYLVEAVQSESYKVYEVSDWSDTQDAEHNDGNMLYNFKKDGKEILSEYVTSKAFLLMFEEETGKKINAVNDAKSYGYEVVSKVAYREKKLLKEIK